MEIWQAIVLGAVQGFAEFLPISSSGHLMLLQYWFGIEEAFFYSIMLHIGTLIPVIIVLWKEIWGLFKKPFNKLWYLVLATIPAGIVGLLFSSSIDEIFSNNVWLLGITFILTATELMFSEMRCKKVQMLNPINNKTGLIMGLGQAIGVVPGLSRSGTTISAGVLAKVEKNENANFTFLMSIPIILAAVLLEGIDVVRSDAIININIPALILGVITSAVCGYISIKFMLNIIKKANYKWFSLYLVLLAITTFLTAII